MPLVSVVVPTHNRSSLLRQALDSILAVEHTAFDLEIIVIDDGSTDATPDVVASYPVVYRRTSGIGASGARNVGMETARGDFIAFLDDDDVWLPGNITPQLQLLDQHPEYGAVYAQVLLTNPDRVPFGEPAPPGPLPSGWIFDSLLTHWPQLGSLVVRSSVVRDIGGFDRSLRSEEEWDWLLRIANRYPIGRIEQPVMLFRQRLDSDEALAWNRFHDTVKVFKRHTQTRSPARWLRLQRTLWAHRGWYASVFVQSAWHHASQGAYARTLLCFRYAVAASPIHTVLAAITHGPQLVRSPHV